MIATLAVELLRAHVNQGAAFAAVHGELADRIAQTASDAKIRNFQITALIYE